MPDDEDVGNAGNRVPAPLLGSALGAVGSEEPSQDHDHVSNDGHGDVGTAHAGQETEVEKQKRRGQAPVNVASPEDLAVNLLGRVWDVVVLVVDNDLVDRDTVAGGHGEVRDGSNDGDDCGNDMVDAFRLGGSVSLLDAQLPRLPTTGSLHDKAAKPAEASTMRTKTTHSVLVPASPTNCSMGVSGLIEGMGATRVGVAVGTGARDVFLKTWSSWSTIILGGDCMS